MYAVHTFNLLAGMINQARPATNRLPNVQKAAMKLSIEPRLDLGWNSAKYDQMTGPLPPSLYDTKSHTTS